MSVRLGRNGRAFVAPAGTELPASVDDELDPAFDDLGEVSEEGLEHVFSVDTGELRNWKGMPVANTTTNVNATFKLKFYETIQSVVELFYGQDLEVVEGGSKIKLGQPLPLEYVLYIAVYDGDPDDGGRIKGYALAKVAVSDRGSIVEKGDDTGYEITFKALYDAEVDGFGDVLYDDDLADSVS